MMLIYIMNDRPNWYSREPTFPAKKVIPTLKRKIVKKGMIGGNAELQN